MIGRTGASGGFAGAARRLAMVATALIVLLPMAARAQDPTEPEAAASFAVQGAQASPLPLRLVDRGAFHASLVTPRGLLRLEFVDLSIPARGWPLTLARTYWPGAPDTGLGPGWAWSFGVQATRSRDTGTYFVAEADGGESAYAEIRPGEFEAVSGRIASRLHADRDGGLRRVFADGSLERFDAAGRLVRRTGVDGAGYDLLRDAAGGLLGVLHDDGQRLDFERSGGRIAGVTDEIGRRWSFRYENGYLAGVTEPLGRVTGFAQDAAGRLGRVAMADGGVLAITYDANGRVARLEGPGTVATRFDHWGEPETGRLVQTLVDATGHRYRVEIGRDPERADRVSIVTVDPAGTRTVVTIDEGQTDVAVDGRWVGGLVADAAGEPRALLSPAGMLMLPSEEDEERPPMALPDARGMPGLVAENGVPYWQAYDAVGRVVARAGPSGAIERFTLDDGNRLVAWLDDTGAVHQFDYDDGDRLLRWEGTAGRWLAYAYDPLGQVVAISASDVPDQRLAYDASGRLASLFDGRQSWTAGYDDAGRPTGLVAEDGARLSIGYDAAGSLASLGDERGLLVSFPSGIGLVADSLGRARGLAVTEEGETVLLGPLGATTRVEALPDGDSLVTTTGRDGAVWAERVDAAGGFLGAEATGRWPARIATDAEGRIVELGDPEAPIALAYDANGLLLERTGPTGVPTRYTRDAEGRLTGVASPYAEAMLDYDTTGELVAIAWSDGTRVTRQADAAGRVAGYALEGPLGERRTEALAYDSQGRITSHALDGVVRAFDYGDAEGTAALTVTAGTVSQTWTQRHDAATRTTVVVDPDGMETVLEYDAAGRVVASRSPRQVVEVALDPDGLLQSLTIDGFGYDLTGGLLGGPVLSDRRVDEEPDGVVRLQTVLDRRGAEWELGFDRRDLLVRIVDPLGGRTAITRNALGNVTSRTDPDGRAFLVDYDTLDRPVREAVAGGWGLDSEWQGDRPVATAFSGGARLAVEADPAARRVVATLNGAPLARYDFDEVGRLAGAEDSGGRVAFSYAESGHLEAETDIFGRTVGYRRDAIGRLTGIVLPEGDEIAFEHGPGAALSQTGPDGGTLSLAYDPATATYALELDEGVAGRVALAPAALLAGVRLDSASTGETARLAVERDGANGVVSVTVDGLRAEIALDPLGRMTGVRREDGTEARWAYDGSGNVTEAPDGLARTYDEAFRLTALGDEELRYDADGRMTGLGGTVYRYDPAGRLVEVRPADGSPTLLAYDALGRLVRRESAGAVEEYLYAGGHLAAVYDGEGRRTALLERSFVLPQIVRLHAAGGVTTLVPDQVGTPRFAVRGGAIETLAPYGPWGEAPEALPGFARWIGFTGARQIPEAGLVLLDHRAYAPAIQRFLTPDPLGMAGSTNPYAYADWQPATYTDADGRQPGGFGVGPGNLGPEVLPGHGTPSLLGGGLGDYHRQRQIEEVLRSIANGTPGPAQQVAAQTLEILNNGGIDLHLPSNAGHGNFGSAGNGQLTAWIENTSQTLRGRFPNASEAEIRRAVAAVYVHEATHMIQRAGYTGADTLGRLYREFEATLRQGLIETASAGFGFDGSNPRDAVRRGLDYALGTQWRAYDPASGRTPHLPNYGGIFQLDERAVVDLVRRYHPNLPEAEILRIFREAHADAAARHGHHMTDPAARQALRDMLERARIAEMVARRPPLPPPPPALPTPPPPRPPGLAGAAGPARPPTPHPAPPRPPQPTIEWPGRPGGAAATPTGSAAPHPPPRQPGGSDLFSAPDRSVSPEAPRPHAESPRPPRPDTVHGSAPEGPRPAVETPHGSRPVPHAGTRVPDLSSGTHAPRPPHSLPDGPRAPRPPHGATGGGPSLGSRALTALHVGFVALDVYHTIKDLDRYWSGEIGHREFWTNTAMTVGIAVLPWPLSGALMAHQLGSFLGGYAAGKLLDAYNRGDPIARALIDWMRRNGWINANDPTFVAVAEALPPGLRGTVFEVAEGLATPVPVSAWAPVAAAGTLVLRAADGAEAERLPFALRPGLTVEFLPGDLVAALPAGRYGLELETGGLPLRLGEIRVTPAPEPIALPAEPPAAFSVAIDVRETRLAPTDLPWSRFDRPDALIAGGLPDGAETFGDWRWTAAPDAPFGLDVHHAAPDGPPIHYLLLDRDRPVVLGENIVQYLWLDPADPPAQVVIQVYDAALSGAHRISLGADLVPIDDRAGFGLVEGGALPAPGAWYRLRIPVAEIGLDGRRIAGLGFLTDGGRALFGPTRLSGADDHAPLLVRAEGRDLGGDPETDLVLGFAAPQSGRLTVSLVPAEGPPAILFDRRIAAENPVVWWQGPSRRLLGAEVQATLALDDGTELSLAEGIPGNPALVARILYPPAGAVVRQTVPVFGQAGGAAFDRYTVEIRPLGAGEADWRTIEESRAPTVMTEAAVQERIDTIMARQLRATVYGNLASLRTGSALHGFAFAEADPVAPTGWIEVRLTTYDSVGNRAVDGTLLRIGEVATGQVRSVIESPDGAARLIVPPLILPEGMGTLSIDREAGAVAAGAPDALGAAYGIAPAGLATAAPLEIGLRAPEEAQSLVAIDRDGGWRVLPTVRDGEWLSASLGRTSTGMRVYASAAAPPDLPGPDPAPAWGPWFADARPPGLLYAGQALGPHGVVLVDRPIALDGPVAAIFGYEARSLDGAAFVLRVAGDAVVVPLGSAPIGGLSGANVGRPLGLVADGTRQTALWRLDQAVPAGVSQIDRIDLVSLESRAWLTVVADPLPAGRFALEALLVGAAPGGGGAEWRVPAPARWRVEGEEDWSEGPVRLGSEGWHRIEVESVESGAPVSWPVLIDESPPVLTDPRPAPGDRSSALMVTALLQDAGAGVDAGSITASVNGVPVPAAAVRYDGASGRLEIAIGEIGPAAVVADGETVAARVTAADRLGRAMAPAEWSWTYEAAPIALGSAAQVTTGGGAEPAWTADGSAFVFVATVDGQTDLYRWTPADGSVVRLTDTPEADSAPAPHPSRDAVAYLAEGALRLLDGDGSREIGPGLADPAWLDDLRLVGGRDNAVVALSVADGAETVLCEAAPGSTVTFLRPVGPSVAFTQNLYHRTIWLCDPATGTVSPLSADLDDPELRDLHATGGGAGQVIYLRGDGADGLWRRTIGGGDALLLAGGAGIDRRPTLSPDGTVLLFDSDRSGRREIWRLDLPAELRLAVEPARVAATPGTVLALRLTASDGVGVAGWSLLDGDGRPVRADLEVAPEPDAVSWRLPPDLASGRYLVEARTADGLSIRAPLIVDGTPPAILVLREGDGRPVEPGDELAPTDRLVVTAADEGGPVAAIDFAVGDTSFVPLTGPIEVGSFEPGARLRIRAVDAVGNVATLALDLPAPEPAPDPEPPPPVQQPAPQPPAGTPLFVVLLGAGGVLLGLAILAWLVIRRRRRG